MAAPTMGTTVRTFFQYVFSMAIVVHGWGIITARATEKGNPMDDLRFTTGDPLNQRTRRSHV